MTALGSDLLGYWDARRADTLTVVGGAVSSWRSVVGGYDLTQATGTLRPGYSETSFGGDPGLSFDGADDFLALTTHPFPVDATGSEIWALASQDALVADGLVRYAVSMGGSSTTHRSLVRAIGGGINYARSAAGSIISTLTGTDWTGRSVVRGRYTGTEVQASLNGADAPATAVVPTTNNTRMRVGAFVNTSASGFWQGQIAAVLVTAPLSAGKAAPLLAWLASRRRVV